MKVERIVGNENIACGYRLRGRDMVNELTVVEALELYDALGKAFGENRREAITKVYGNRIPPNICLFHKGWCCNHMECEK